MKLGEHPFIRSIPQERREAIIEEIEILRPEAGSTIFEENSTPEALYLILEGSVRFTKKKQDGGRQNLSVSEAGSLFGEVGVITGERRTLRAEAGADAVFGKIGNATVAKIIENTGPVQTVLQSVILHLKSTTSHYLDEMMRQEKLSLVGTMVSSLLHDFKNPFSIISLGTNLIQQKHGSDPKTAEICQNIEEQTRRMVMMANDLAAFARGEGEIEISTVSFKQLFDHFRELNTPYFNDEAINISLVHNDQTLQGDANQLLRVLQNLTANAIEAIHENDQVGQITVSAEPLDQRVILRIEDNGPGIPTSIQSKFFEPFVTFGKSHGTGLGTAIVKSIIDAHQGEISFTTSPTGTTFEVSLPRTLNPQASQLA